MSDLADLIGGYGDQALRTRIVTDQIKRREALRAQKLGEHLESSERRQPSLGELLGKEVSKNISAMWNNPREQLQTIGKNFVETYLPTREEEIKTRLAIQGSVMGDIQPMIDRTMNIFGAGPMAGATVYHGSPHLFEAATEVLDTKTGKRIIMHGNEAQALAGSDRYKILRTDPLGMFDARKIGTGEGNQAQGHGIYIGDLVETGSHYAALGTPWQGVGAKSLPTQAWDEMGPVMRRLDIPGDMPIGRNEADGVRDMIVRYGDRMTDEERAVFTKWAESPGYLYKVEVPDEMVERMLVWDRSLADQTEYVRNALRNIPELQQTLHGPFTVKSVGGKHFVVDRNGEWSSPYNTKAEALRQAELPEISVMMPFDSALGSSIYDQLAEKLGSQEAASAALQRGGIPGNKYWDGRSRALDDRTNLDFTPRTHNYVIFPGEEHNLKILSRNK